MPQLLRLDDLNQLPTHIGVQNSGLQLEFQGAVSPGGGNLNFRFPQPSRFHSKGNLEVS